MADLVVDAKNTVGESIVWDDRTETLYWVDIIAKRIHSLIPESGTAHSRQAPGFVTSIGLRRGGGAVLGLLKDVVLWDFADGFTPLATIEPDLPENRLNESVVGPDGAFWLGTMLNNIEPDGSPKDITASTGRLYRLSASGEVKSLSDDVFGITNTLVWTGDGHLITADTISNALYRYRIGPDNRLHDRKTILEGFERGLPDGSCMDAEGFIWNCRVVGGACVIRLSPDGRVDRIIDLPCSWPTSCAFGGPNLDVLYVTSARFTMNARHLAAHPQEGGLFAIDAGVAGLPANRFG
jgi:sugar lactone lactonase YvrE